MKKNLVLGILDNYTFHQVKKFVVSIKQTGFTGDLCLFVGSKTTPSTIRLLKKYGVIVHHFQNVQSLPAGNLAAEKFPLRTPINYYNYRHYLYYDFLERNKEKYNYVLLTDVRDVYFQRDPFDFEIGEGLNCALEGKTKMLKECAYNGPWVEYIYGKEGLDKVGDNVISCAGTSWGTVPVMLDYLTQMLTELQKIRDAKIAIDQAIHNYMIYTGMLGKVSFLNNEDGVILTLSYETNYTIDKDNIVRVPNGRIINTLHQFPRMPDLQLATDKLYMKGGLTDFVAAKISKFELFIHKNLVQGKLMKPHH